jgi:hypothetical protein
LSERVRDLQSFLDAAHAAFAEFATHEGSRSSIVRIFSALKEPAVAGGQPPSRLPVCAYRDQVADPQRFESPTLQRLASAFMTLEPQLSWGLRGSSDDTASANFWEGHANAMIAGPGGMERRSDVLIGVSLLGPHVRYPDHRHPPEETYLVMSGGEFRQGDGPWFAPGVGGSFYNEPNIRHAMRSGEGPLLAFWALWARPHVNG